MGSTTVDPKEYWGYLIKTDKSPCPRLEQLLLGIANYINKHIAPWDVHCLSPTKLAAFYRLVGGNYDILFLETPSPSLSLIYQTLGCYHTLQPDKDPFAPPTIPSLTTLGFVRWQTVQMLLRPEAHVPFLQAAVKRFEIINPGNGKAFPSILPKESFPMKADVEMTRWHECVSQRLLLEVEALEAQKTPKPAAIDESKGMVDSRQSSIDDQSVSDAAEYFAGPRARQPFIPSRYSHLPPNHREGQRLQVPTSPAYLEGRRNSSPDNRINYDPYTGGHRRTSTGSVPQVHHRSRSRPQTPSTLSTSSGSEADDDTTSITASEGSLSPRSQQRTNRVMQPPPAKYMRRHSAHDARDYALQSQSRAPDVSWRAAQYAMTDGCRSTVSTPGFRSARDERVSNNTSTSALRGVGGRRYAPPP